MTDSLSSTRGRFAAVACSIVLTLGTACGTRLAMAQQITQPAAPQADTDGEIGRARQEAMDQLKQLGLALQKYHVERKSYPPAFIAAADGKPLLSWRVAILPYLEGDHGKLYAEFHLDEPWDSEHNKPLVEKIPKVLRCPGSRNAASGLTVYQTPRGDSTAFPGAEGIAIRKITDGLANTIAVVEVDEAHAAPWTKPEDWTFDPTNPGQGLGGHFLSRQFLCVFCDGSIHAVATTWEPDKLRALFTRRGGEVVALDD